MPIGSGPNTCNHLHIVLPFPIGTSASLVLLFCSLRGAAKGPGMGPGWTGKVLGVGGVAGMGSGGTGRLRVLPWGSAIRPDHSPRDFGALK